MSALQKVMGRFTSYDSWTNVGADGVVIAFRDHEITFDDLAFLAEVYKTKKIFLGGEVRDDGYCDTCRETYSATVVRIMEIPSEVER